jgi:hypothetical protein
MLPNLKWERLGVSIQLALVTSFLGYRPLRLATLDKSFNTDASDGSGFTRIAPKGGTGLYEWQSFSLLFRGTDPYGACSLPSGGSKEIPACQKAP